MSTHAQNSSEEAGVLVVPSAVPSTQCNTWFTRVDTAYGELDTNPSPDFVTESSSLRLRSIRGLAAIDIWSALSTAAQQRCADVLGPALAIDVDQCWVRRQHSPSAAPPRHRPHSWHQDGALGFRFTPGRQHAIPADELLPMITCWVALTPCGLDAPGLEFVDDRVDHLLSPMQLADDSIDSAWPASQRTQPALQAGDALIFDGAVVHRTHVTAAMTATRTSIELRCFCADALPARLCDDTFATVALHG